MGENGVGKLILMNILIGFFLVSIGIIYIDGEEWIFLNF